MAMDFEIAVVGAGIVGLATARALKDRGVRRVVVLEAEDRVGAHQSSHNSGVVHSGLYYRPGSLKATTCTAGREAMYRFCESRGIPHRRTGKLVVATRESELPRLRQLEQRGFENGLKMDWLDGEQVREAEPHVDALAALRVAEAGIVDYGAVTEAFGREFVAAGGELWTGSRVLAVRDVSGGLDIQTGNGGTRAAVLVNCGGLHSDRLARMCGMDPGLRIVPFRGEYYGLTPEATGLVRNPVYPVPDPALPFLGVHLTPTIDGDVEAGPNAVLAFKREGYGKLDFSARDLRETITYPGFRALARRHWRSGISELARSASKTLFVRSLQRLVPALRSRDLVRGKSGVRAQAVDPDGGLVDDFRILYGHRTVHVLNAPSPAATASISIGNAIADRVLRQMLLDPEARPGGG